MMTSDAALFNSGCISPPSFPPRCLVPHVSRDMPTGPRLERDRSSPAITLVMRVRYTGVKATQLAKVSRVDLLKIADHIYADLKGLGIPQPQKANMYKLMNEEDTVYMYWDTVEGSNILTELTRKVGEAGGNDLKATQLTSVMVYKLGPRTTIIPISIVPIAVAQAGDAVAARSEASPPATVDPRKRETRSSTMTSSPGDALLHDQQTTSPPDIRSATQSLSKSAVVERSQASAPPVSSKMVLHTAFPSLKKAAAIEPHNRGIARPAITMQIKYCSEVASLTGSQPELGASSPSPPPSLLSQPHPFPPLQSEISECVQERFITFEPKERGDMVRCDEGEDMEVAEGQGQAEDLIHTSVSADSLHAGGLTDTVQHEDGPSRKSALTEDVVPHEMAGPGNLQTELAPQDQVSNRKSNVTSHMIDLEELANSVVSQPSRNRAASIASTMSVSDSGTVVSSLHVDGLGKLNAFSDDPVEPPSSDMIIAEHLRAMGQYRHQLFVEAKAREEMQRRIDALQARAEEAERRADSLEQKRKAEVQEAAEAEDNSRRKRRKLKKEVLDLEDRLMGYKHLADERKEKLYKARESENVVIKRLLDLVGGDGKELSGNIEDHVDESLCAVEAFVQELKRNLYLEKDACRALTKRLKNEREDFATCMRTMHREEKQPFVVPALLEALLSLSSMTNDICM